MFILPMLLLLASCFYRTTHDLGLGLQLAVPHSELVLLQTTAAATARAATATTIEEIRSELVLRFWLCGVAAVEGEDTRLH